MRHFPSPYTGFFHRRRCFGFFFPLIFRALFFLQPTRRVSREQDLLVGLQVGIFRFEIAYFLACLRQILV